MNVAPSAAGSHKQHVDIVLVFPPAVPISEPAVIDVHFRPVHDRTPSLSLAATYEGRPIGAKPIDANAGVVRMEVHCETAGCVVFTVQSEDGTLGSNRATVAVVPSNIRDELSRIFDESLVGLLAAAKDGMLPEENISVAELENNTILAKSTAWRRHFHCLMQDVGELLSHIATIKRTPDLMNKPKPFELSSKLSHVLVFFLDNHAYSVGNYILGEAMEVGETVTLDGIALDAKDIDLEYLHQMMHRSPHVIRYQTGNKPHLK